MRLILSFLLLGALTAQVFAASSVKSLLADEFQAAGLHKLSESELAEFGAATDMLVCERIHAVQNEARAAEAKAQVEGQMAAASSRGGPTWSGILLTLDKAGARSGEELQGVLKGTLQSFRGRHSLTLENGQGGQMIDHDSYAGPANDRPEVFIRPGTTGNFWLRIPQAAVRGKITPQWHE